MKHPPVSPLWVLLAAIPEEKQDHPALHCFLFSRRQQKYPLLGQQPQPCMVPLRLNLPSSRWGKVSFSRGGNAWLWRGGERTMLICTSGGFSPPCPACRGNPKHTSIWLLELKSPFACLERDNLSDTSCCKRFPHGHTCYYVTACVKNVGRRWSENDYNRVCTNNLWTSLCESFYHVRCVSKAVTSLGKEKGGKKEEEEKKARWQCWGKCFCGHTMRFKTGWKWSPRSPSPSPLLPHLWKSYSGGFQG